MTRERDDRATPAPSSLAASIEAERVGPLSRRQIILTLAASLIGFPGTPSASTAAAPSTTQAFTMTTRRAASPASKTARTTHDADRLPRHIVPSRYDISITPDLTAGTFEGIVVIAVSVRKASRAVWLNAADLTVTDALISNTQGSSHRPTIAMDAAHERCSLNLPRALATGDWTIRLSFRGTLSDRLSGFYISNYTDADGAPQRLAVTQFEAADARRAFPCWDEPDFKAVFALTLIIDPQLTAVSNTRVVHESEERGKKVLQFADSMVMSTYLLAFVVGRLEATEPTLVGPTQIRVWTVPGKTHLGRYGQEWATFSLRFFEEYYGIPYPGDKLDLIAIPDFSYGAMENLGAVTFRESALLVDPNAAAHGDLQGLADVVSHENAHMWFGDLVTMAWWNGLWLNEAFATLMEVVAVDAWKPEWRRWDQFALSRAGALATDGLFASRAIEFPVRAVKDLGAMFDVLTYQKGAAVLRMLEQFLGAPVFRDGVRRYLRTHAYANTDTHDLWNALTAASSHPVGDIMQHWVFSPGYPLVAAARQRDRQGAQRLELSQERFTYLDKAPPASAKTQRGGAATRTWQIPLRLAIETADGITEMPVLMKTSTMRIPLPDDCLGVQVNPGAHGYYRVCYAPELRDRLLSRFSRETTASPSATVLEPVDRFNLVNDHWALCLSGRIPLGDYLSLTDVAIRDRSPQVWSILLASFEKLEPMLDHEDRPLYEAWLRTRLTPIYTELGWEPRDGESDLQRELRGSVLDAMGTLANDTAAQAEAARRYAAALADPTTVDPNVLPALISIAAGTGDESRYQDFFARFRAGTTPQEERRYLFSLVDFRSPALVARTLQSTLNGEIRTQDAASIVGALLSTRHGHDAAWDFLVAHWNTIAQRWPANGQRRLFSHLSTRATALRERAIHRFVAQHKIDLGGKALAQSLEHVRIAVAFRARHRQAFLRVLRMPTPPR